MKTKDSKIKKLLLYLAGGTGILVLSLLNPAFPQQLLRAYTRQKKFQRGRFLRDLKRLQQRDLIDFRENPNGEVAISLKRRGKVIALKCKLDDMQLKRPKRWDGKWRLVIFDIPHYQKQARDALRRKLLELGFYALQKSVFITPYSCEDEIDFIGEIFGVRENILVITVDDFEGIEKMTHYFGLD